MGKPNNGDGVKKREKVSVWKYKNLLITRSMELTPSQFRNDKMEICEQQPNTLA